MIPLPTDGSGREEIGSPSGERDDSSSSAARGARGNGGGRRAGPPNGREGAGDDARDDARVTANAEARARAKASRAKARAKAGSGGESRPDPQVVDRRPPRPAVRRLRLRAKDDERCDVALGFGVERQRETETFAKGTEPFFSFLARTADRTLASRSPRRSYRVSLRRGAPFASDPFRRDTPYHLAFCSAVYPGCGCTCCL